MLIAQNAFRQYDIRGKVGQELPISQIYALAHAVAAFILEKNNKAQRIIIGRDGRTHSKEIQCAFVQALCDAGFSVHDTGVCPTPVVYFACHYYPYDAAVMITASHNGPEYNGFKLCLGKNTIWAEDIQRIKELYSSGKQVVQQTSGSVAPVMMQKEYRNYIAQKFIDLKNFDKHLVADCGNGAVGAVLRDVIQAVGLSNVTILCEEVDGTYPNHSANPVERENMEHVAHYVSENDAFLAVGFDGDGDRMAAMTPEGRLLAGDELLSLFAQDVLARNPGASIVFDSKCLMIVPQTIQKCGGNPIQSPSGHSHMKTVMRDRHALLGGELSCHFFFADDYFGFDDGIYAFLRLVRLVAASKKNITQLIEQFPQTYNIPEIRIFCADDTKNEVIEQIKKYFIDFSEYKLSYADGIRFYTDTGWGLIRVSHTQPALCLRCESLTAEGLKTLKQKMYDALMHTVLAHYIPSESFLLKEHA